MAANIEVKVAVGGLVPLRARLRAMNARRVGVLRQRDTYFGVEGVRLKLREEGRAASLIPYVRPDRAGDRRSTYALIPVIDGAFAKRYLRDRYRVRVVVDKVREYWRVDRTRVHLDRVLGLGTFLELETEAHPAARQECRRVLAALGLARAPAIAGSYADLSAEALSKRRRRGRTAKADLPSARRRPPL